VKGVAAFASEDGAEDRKTVVVWFLPFFLADALIFTRVMDTLWLPADVFRAALDGAGAQAELDSKSGGGTILMV